MVAMEMTPQMRADAIEWTEAEEAMSRVLGFRVVRAEGDPHAYQMQFMEDKQLPNGKTEWVPRNVRPCQKWEYDLWQQAVRGRIDHNHAAKLAWDLYSAATGISIDNFNGMGAGGPIESVKVERAMWLKAANELNEMLTVHETAAQEIAKLVAFLKDNKQAPRSADDSPVDVAIRLMQEVDGLKEHIEADHETLRQKQELIDRDQA